MTLDTLTTFFGWMALLNIGLLSIMTLAMILMRDWAANLHARLFDIDPTVVNQVIYSWLANYKLAPLILTVIPYFALRLI